jgi:hypothetical protein
LTGVRLLHLEAGLANPLPSFFKLDRALRGIKRVKGDTNLNRKLAVTPDLLARVIRRLDYFSPFNPAFVAAMLVAFFGFVLQGGYMSLICPAKESSTPTEDISPVRRCNFESAPDGTLVWVNLRRTKTIRYGQRILRVLSPPSRARFYARLPLFSRQRLFSLVPAPPKAFAFSYAERAGARLTTFIHRSFVSQLKAQLPYVEVAPTKYAGHYFRRGGATFAFQCGAPAAKIKEQGDWKSAAYLLYESKI